MAVRLPCQPRYKFCLSLFIIKILLATEFEPRTRETHASHSMLLNTSSSQDFAITYGLTHDSILNSSRFFNVTNGLSPDCMHDILEGCLQYEVNELLRSLVERKFIKLEALKKRIELLPYSQPLNQALIYRYPLLITIRSKMVSIMKCARFHY